MSWHCAVCNIHCPSDYQKEEHLAGAKHFENMQVRVNSLKRGANFQIPFCGCKVAAAEKTVQKLGPNKGRTFFTCAKTKCKFFEWADVDNSISRQAVFNSPQKNPKNIYTLTRAKETPPSPVKAPETVPTLPDSLRDKFSSTNIRFSISNGDVNLAFSYNAALIDIIKKFRTRKYDGTSKTWSIPLSGFQETAPIFAFLGIRVPNAIMDAAQTTIKTETSLKLIHQTNSVQLEFDYAPDIINAVKQVHPKQRQYFADLKTWACTLTSLPELLEALYEIGFEPTDSINTLLLEAQKKIQEEKQKEKEKEKEENQQQEEEDEVQIIAEINRNAQREYERQIVEMEQQARDERRSQEYLIEMRQRVDMHYAHKKKQAEERAKVEKKWKENKIKPVECECGHSDRWIVAGVHACRFFGHFKCTRCSNSWTSAYAWKGESQNCKRCDTETMYHKAEQLKRKEGDTEVNRGYHDSARCGMCKKLARNGDHGGCNLSLSKRFF